MICQKVQIFGSLKVLLTLLRTIYGAGNFKRLPLQFLSNLGQTLSRHCLPYRLLIFLAMSQLLQILWYFEILAWENPKICNRAFILKTADHRAKRMNIWDSRCSAYVRHFSCLILWVQFGSFSALCKISRCSDQFSKGNSSPSFLPISTKLYGTYGNWGRIQAKVCFFFFFFFFKQFLKKI